MKYVINKQVHKREINIRKTVDPTQREKLTPTEPGWG